MFKDYLEIYVNGKNIKRFILKMHHLKVDLENIRYLSNEEAYLKIKKSDYKTVLKYKSIYEVTITSFYGLSKLKLLFNKNKIMIVSCIIGCMILYFLSNLVFKITVVHSDSTLQEYLLETLESYGIKKYSFVKDYNELRKITADILEKNKDKLEWLEIETIGTSYRVLVQERLLNPEVEESLPQNIVSAKAGVLKRIVASKGIIVKELNTYVDKGEIIVTGEIPNKDSFVYVKAKADVYAEVWYTINISQPLVYKEENKTGNEKINYCISFFQKDLCLFPKYIDSKDTVNKLLYNPLLPLAFERRKEEEFHIIDEIYTIEEATSIAIEKGKKKIEASLDEKEYIISEKVLKKVQKDSTIEVEIFYKVYENIASAEKIEPKELEPGD